MVQILQVPHGLRLSGRDREVYFCTVYLGLDYKAALNEGYGRGWLDYRPRQ